jgi:hypothetical protein
MVVYTTGNKNHPDDLIEYLQRINSEPRTEEHTYWIYGNSRGEKQFDMSVFDNEQIRKYVKQTVENGTSICVSDAQKDSEYDVKFYDTTVYTYEDGMWVTTLSISFKTGDKFRMNKYGEWEVLPEGETHAA